MKIKYLTMFSIICLLGILSLTNVLAWSNNTFNNSLSIENLTFTGSQNFTRYLSIPQGTPLTYGYLNLSGYINQTYNYQSAGLSTQTDCSDSDWSASYPCARINNGDSGTQRAQANSGTVAVGYFNWTKPSNTVATNNTLSIKVYGTIAMPTYTYSINSSCFNQNINAFKFTYDYTTGFVADAFVDIDCYDGSWIRIARITTDGYGGYIEGIIEFTNNYNITNISQPTNVSLTIGNSNVWNYTGQFNQTNNKTNNLASSINSYLGTCSYSNGLCQVPFTFHSDISGTLQYSGLNFSGDYNGFIENSQTFSTSVFPSASESFIINLTYDSSYYSSISANLYYNGTNYLGTRTGSGNSAIFTKALTIPNLQVGNQTFYWTIALTNSTGVFYFNSTFQNQTINSIIFVRCNSTYYNPILVNFTIRDEINTNTLVDAVMKATFYYSLDNSYSRTYSLETEANSTFQFCSNYNATFNVKSIIQLNNDSYIQRTYDLINNFTNDTTQKNLYLLSGTNGTNIIVEVKDSGNNPLPNYFVEIYRYYPETDSYSLIVGSTTDLYGQFSARLIENTVKYKFIFKDSNGVIKKTSEGITINCRATICVLPFIIEDTTDFFSEFNQTSWDWSFTFDNNTNIFTFSWNDVSGVSATSRLLVERIAVNGSSIICNSTSTAESGSITCDVGDSSSGYIGQIFRRINGVETRIATLNINVGHEARDIFGREGLMWCFFLFMTLISVGVYKPPIGIVLFLLGSLTLGLIIPITYLTGGILIAEFVIGCIFIWAFKG